MKKYRKLIIPLSIMIIVLVISGCGQKPTTNAGNANSEAGTTANPQQASRPNPTPAPTPTPKSWKTPPIMAIDPNKQYEAAVETSKGTFTIELFAKDAPITVNNFIFLAKEHFYDGIVFHRIVQTFMVQTGDPTGTGSGGPGYKFEDELNSPHQYDVGIVAMANSGPNTNGSQFFICTGEDCKGLNRMPNYTIFGKVKDGMDVVQTIAATPVQLNKRMREVSAPTEKITIDSITITEK